MPPIQYLVEGGHRPTSAIAPSAGPSRLKGALMTSPDIRAGMAMLLAAVCAEGVSTINNADQIERGYERADERFNARRQNHPRAGAGKWGVNSLFRSLLIEEDRLPPF